MTEISFYGSSLVSSYWNGAATYYRGLLESLHRLGYRITFYEPDAFERQAHRDIEDPDYARVVVYPATSIGLAHALQDGLGADVVVKASGVGVFDDELLEAVATDTPRDSIRIFWDVDAPATLSMLAAEAGHPLHRLLPHFDAVLTYGGGDPVVSRYRGCGAKICQPVYNAADTATHHPVEPEVDFSADLSFLGNRLPDREERVEEFFFKPARLLPQRRFLLGGSGWENAGLPSNVHYIGHVPTAAHNAFNASPAAVLNVSRLSMAQTGFSPATRVFEAAAAGACLITDEWEGIGSFFEPDSEVLVANNGDEVARHLRDLDPVRSKLMGSRALERVRREHSYRGRALEVDDFLRSLRAGNGESLLKEYAT